MTVYEKISERYSRGTSFGEDLPKVGKSKIQSFKNEILSGYKEGSRGYILVKGLLDNLDREYTEVIVELSLGVSTKYIESVIDTAVLVIKGHSQE